MPKEKLTLLIDGDILAFKAAARNQKTFDFDDTELEPAIHLNHSGTLHIDMDNDINQWMEELSATDYIIFLSCPSEKNWRKNVLKTYKGNRDPSKNPKLLRLAKEILRTYHPVVEEPSLEADDLMGIYSTDPNHDLVEGERCIVSIDKDMQTIPGFLFNPDKDLTMRYICTDAADQYHMEQTITGDTTDNYKGCPGAGNVLAEDMLNNRLKLVPYIHTFTKGAKTGTTEIRFTKESAANDWETVVSIYEKAGLTDADALVQARVARILRAGEYNFKKRKVILWEP